MDSTFLCPKHFFPMTCSSLEGYQTLIFFKICHIKIETFNVFYQEFMCETSVRSA